MSSILLFDIGSSTAKAYMLREGKATPIGRRSFELKNGFSPENGYSKENLQALLGFLDEIKATHTGTEAKAFGTALMRTMTMEAQEETRQQFLDHGIALRVLSQQEESDYMVHALMDRCTATEPFMIINIGGGSMEIVIVEHCTPVHTIHVDQGVNTVHTQHADLNNDPPPLPYSELVDELVRYFPPLPQACRYAFNTGGELTWTRIAKYALRPNTLFDDADHPSLLSIQDWNARSEEIYNLTIGELKAMVPDNPAWMMGARGFMVLTSAVIAAYSLEALIPSDANLIDGIARTLE